jgi:RNA polymerase sigma-70 factor (ECF subfamily)
MSDELDFRDLIRRVRAGDEAAILELLRQYEPEIKRLIRVRMTDPRLRRTTDSMDVCQSVLANFFVRVAAGQFDLDDPAQLRQLLLRMTQNKIQDHIRRQQAERRDVRRQDAGAEALGEVPGQEATPSHIIANRELLREVRRRLTAEERYLAEQRGLGRDWADLAAELNKSPDALRHQLTRGLDRVAAELGLDGEFRD